MDFTQNHSTATTDETVENRIDKQADDAFDTLGYLFQAFGRDGFRIDVDPDGDTFPEQCSGVARHIENGAAVLDLDIADAAGGARNWGAIRRFFADRRRDERSFVERTLGDYRTAVEDLVVGLADLCQHTDLTEERVSGSLAAMSHIVESGKLPEIKAALAEAILSINAAFREQKESYEKQIESLQSGMSGLREDLMAAHEEMKLDPLTELYNRRAFDTAIERFINVHYVVNQPVSLVMIDVDNFKTINDTLGHAAGDDLLKAVSDLMTRAFIRKNDLICRYGGDEFAVILPETPVDKSSVSIERFLDSVRALTLPDWPEELVVSCSAGCAGITAGDTVETLVERADAALYAAKQSGRNCLRIG